MWRFFVAAAATVGVVCPAQAGFGLGNPDNMVSTGGLRVDQAMITSATLILEDCDGNELWSYGPSTYDTTSLVEVAAVAGTCTVILEHSGTIDMEGDDGGTGTYELDLSLPDLTFTFDTAVPAGGGDYIIELMGPGWTTVTELGLSSGNHETIDHTDAVHDTIRDRVVADAAIYDDSDDDGAIDATERSAGPVAE